MKYLKTYEHYNVSLYNGIKDILQELVDDGFKIEVDNGTNSAWYSATSRNDTIVVRIENIKKEIEYDDVVDSITQLESYMISCRYHLHSLTTDLGTYYLTDSKEIKLVGHTSSKHDNKNIISPDHIYGGSLRLIFTR